MNRICKLHDIAMDIMNEAIAYELENKLDDARALFIQACDLESRSAHLVEKKKENEPSRGMLFLGAASLAFRGAAYSRAKKLVREGLSGFPSVETSQDLLELDKKIACELAARKKKNKFKAKDIVVTTHYGRVYIMTGMGAMKEVPWVQDERCGQVWAHAVQRRAGRVRMHRLAAKKTRKS